MRSIEWWAKELHKSIARIQLVHSWDYGFSFSNANEGVLHISKSRITIWCSLISYPDTRWWWGNLTPLQRCSRLILDPHPRRWLNLGRECKHPVKISFITAVNSLCKLQFQTKNHLPVLSKYIILVFIFKLQIYTIKFPGVLVLIVIKTNNTKISQSSLQPWQIIKLKTG